MEDDALFVISTSHEDIEKKKRATSCNINNNNNNNTKKGLSSNGGSSSSSTQRCCQADKCSADLADAKQYHRRHKVCEYHAKAQAVVVAGLRQRFCQQCSRFHEVTEFDESKRSCRRRLAGHNERRRKISSSSAAAESNNNNNSAAAEGGVSRILLGSTAGTMNNMCSGEVDDRAGRRIIQIPSIQESNATAHYKNNFHGLPR